MAAIDQLSGTTLGAYELRTLLGQGGMGAVYRAFQPALNREVAIKLLKMPGTPQPGYLERFIREAQTAATLEHPHIVAVHDFGSQTLADGTQVYYIVMRMLTGGTLAERLSDGHHLTPLETASILTQLAGALDYAHQRGVIHRDIKPGNVMFDAAGSAYIVDFGIARLATMETLTETGTAMGTPAFMAPEQWRGESITPAADQYSLGVLVYRMLTGSMPFTGDSPYTLMYQHLNQQPTPPDGIRSDLAVGIGQALQRAMAKEPDDRYATLSDFARTFRAAVEAQDDLPTAAVRTRPTSRASTPVLENVPTTTILTGQGVGMPVEADVVPKPRPTFPLWILPAIALPVIAILLIGIALRPSNSPGSDQASATPADLTGTPELTAAGGVDPTATFLISVNPVEAATAAAMSRAIDEHPDDPDAYFERGSAFIGYGDCVDAIPDFTRVIELNPEHELGYLSRAYCYSETGQPEAGAQDALTYIQLRQSELIHGDLLLPDQPVTLDIKPTTIYGLPISLSAGQTLTVTADAASESLDPLLILLAPDGTPVIHNDDVSLSQSNFNAAISNFKIPADGDYVVVVTHAAGGDNGEVTVTLRLTTF